MNRINIAKIGWLLGGIALACLYVNGAIQQSRQVNTDMHRTDQSAYMAYAKALAESNYTYIGDRNRMPLYPFLQSLLYEPGLSDEDFFVRGKRLNIALSVAFLIGLFFILQKHLPLMAATNLILITAFTVFIFKAGFFQAELLFYFLNFFCFLLMNKLLHRPKWQWGVLTGVMLGIAHLTKASVLVGLVLFLAAAVLQEAYKLYRQKRSQDTGTPRTKKQLIMNLVSIACVAIMFLATVGRYISNSKKIYGSYFYNVNSTFYMWYDSWEEAKKGTRAHGDRVGWPDMPAELIPSPSKYLREHSMQQIAGRFLKGTSEIVNTAMGSYGYFRYFFTYLMFCLYMMIVDRQLTREFFRQYAFLFLFNLMYFAVYLLLYAWYTPINSGNRFTLAQFLPLMFGLSFVIFRLYSKQMRVPHEKGQSALVKAFTTVVAILLIYDVYIVLSQKISTMYGGW
jgi:hypothetical protein